MSDFNILSVNFNHDGSGVIVSNGKITGYINTERFSKKKKHSGIRKSDLYRLLDQASLGLNDLDLVILCNIHNMGTEDIMTLHGSSLMETWFSFWVNQTLDKVIIENVEIPCLVNPDHHLQHCALAYYTSPFEDAICFSWDPTGYGVFAGKGNELYNLKYGLKNYNSCRWYTEVATTLFGTGILGAGKVMGLAPYGRLNGNMNGNGSAIVNTTDRKISNLQELYNFSAGAGYVQIDEGPVKLNATLAFNVQQIMEEQLKTVLDELYGIAREQDIGPNLCLGGGGALNSVANQIAFENSKFEKLHIHPASGDDGTAIGAGLWYWFNYLNKEKHGFLNRELMYSIDSYDDEVESILGSPMYAGLLEVEISPDYITSAAQYLANGSIIGWFQGPSEIGPRALGNRSILADARDPDMKDVLNDRVKFREGFRPFAPCVLNEYAEEWFGLKDSPFMLRVSNVLKPDIPAASHVDNTARIQTVKSEDNPTLYKLIEKFHSITGVPVLINTSFNIKGEPIVETPQDAINCFLQTKLDLLVFKNIIVRKAKTM